MIFSNYLYPLFESNGLEKASNSIIRKVKNRSDFDIIAFQGLSGSLVSSIVATKLKKRIVVIRKKEDKSHYSLMSGRKIEGLIDITKKYIIIDDRIESGETIKNIVKTINDYQCNKSKKMKCVGIYLYNQSGSFIPTDKNWKVIKQFPVYFCGGTYIATSKKVYLKKLSKKR